MPEELRRQCREWTPDALRRLYQLMDSNDENIAFKAVALVLAYGNGPPKQVLEAEARETIEGEVVLPEGMSLRDALLLMKRAREEKEKANGSPPLLTG